MRHVPQAWEDQAQSHKVMACLGVMDRRSPSSLVTLGVTQRAPHRSTFPRVTGCQGADLLEVSSTSGRIVGVTWQGGAGAHRAAGEGLPQGLRDRARRGRKQ